MDEIVQYIVSVVSEWAGRMPAFIGIPLEDLNRSWAYYFSGGRHSKMVDNISWHSPPEGSLKLCFDGSYVHQICMRGFGRVIHDWSGRVIKNFSSPISSSDANGAEVFALLVGRSKLQKMGGYNAIIEDDSFSAIQSGKSSFSWRMSVWVEVQSAQYYFQSCYVRSE